MSVAQIGLAVCLAMAGLSALAGLLVPVRLRSAVVGCALAVSGGAAVVAGVAGTAGERLVVDLPAVLPLFGVHVVLDQLGGFFVAVTGAVASVVGVYHVGYGRRAGRVTHVVLAVFVAALMLVPLAASVATFLLCWELMALASLLLVLSEHRKRASVTEAGVWYAVLTHLGLVTILVGLVLFATQVGTQDGRFEQLREGAEGLSPALRSLVFGLTLVGFASKAGIVPLHAWLPRAHPEAPSQVSALMSAAMVNLGVYGILRVGFDLLGGGPAWWWLVVLVLGSVSAVYGILQAAMATDLKRMLGWSTTENLGLVLVGVGAGGMFAATGEPVVAGLAITAALLHILNHATFKTVLFLSAGSVLHATGTRDLDSLGGLRIGMPATTAFFGVGALAASALPPGNAFVSEWLLLQSLVHGLRSNGVGTAVTMTIAVAAIALTAGVGVATLVKAFGIGFLAKPRSQAAARATESPTSMLAAAGLMSGAILVLAMFPGLLLPLLGGVASTMTSHRAIAATQGLLTLRLDDFAGSISPLIVAVALTVAGLLLVLALRVVLARRQRRAARLWDCGAGPLTARMEYTATSFAEPLQRVFDDVLAPEQDVNVTHVTESRYLVDSIEYRRRVPDRIERRLYHPVITLARRWGKAGRQLANGSVHRYLGYGFVTLTGVLILLAVTR
ncbi:proton-conducting transporter transmembrane domain-containing protein [Flindersiella endophytica]